MNQLRGSSTMDNIITHINSISLDNVIFLKLAKARRTEAEVKRNERTERNRKILERHGLIKRK